MLAKHRHLRAAAKLLAMGVATAAAITGLAWAIGQAGATFLNGWDCNPIGIGKGSELTWKCLCEPGAIVRQDPPQRGVWFGRYVRGYLFAPLLVLGPTGIGVAEWAADVGVIPQRSRGVIPFWAVFLFLLAPATLLCAMLWGLTMLFRRLRAHIRRLLHVPGTCSHCGYNLYGLATPRCPECGTAFVKAV